jgi:hypothetical protein
MKWNETTVLTVPGLYEFSGTVSAAIKECARLQPSAVFAPQFSLVDDTVEVGDWQETKHPICVGRKLGHITQCPSAAIWAGIIAGEDVQFAVTIDEADVSYITQLKNRLATAVDKRIGKNLIRNSDSKSCYIPLSDSDCDIVFSSKTTREEKVEILSGFMRGIDQLL